MTLNNNKKYTFGKRMAKLRLDKRITQTALATECRIAYSHVSAIEAGTKIPSLALAQRIADTLNCTVGYLIGETEYVNTPYLGVLNDLINLIRDEDRVVLTALAKLMLSRMNKE